MIEMHQSLEATERHGNVQQCVDQEIMRPMELPFPPLGCNRILQTIPPQGFGVCLGWGRLSTSRAFGISPMCRLLCC